MGNKSLIVTRALEGSVVLVLATVIGGSTPEKTENVNSLLGYQLWLQEKMAAWCMADGRP